jgi:hypothetical protein
MNQTNQINQTNQEAEAGLRALVYCVEVLEEL